MADKEYAWSTLVLPSRGEFYLVDGNTVVPDGKILVRRMDYAEEEKLNAPGMDYLDRLNLITRGCVRLPDEKRLTTDDMLTTDRMSILLFIRVLTYGPVFNFSWRCSECNAMSRTDVNIMESFDTRTPDKVRLTLSEKEPDATLEEPWTLLLPECGKSLQLRFLRGRDEAAVFSRSKRARMASTDGADSSMAFRIAKQIVSVDGVAVNPKDVLNTEAFVKNTLTPRDRAKVRISTERRETAIDTTLYPKCRSCGADNETAVQFGADFFRPSDVG